MKKEYISPAAVVVELDSEALMIKTASDETQKTNDVFSRKRGHSDALDSEDWDEWEEE